MKTTKLLLTAILLFVLGFAQAQNNYNPWKKYGYTPPKALTLSDGKYQEFFDNDTIVQIGSVMFNTITNQVVAFVEYDTTYSEATLEPHVISRWLSPDPLESEFPSWTPYNYGFNNPVYWTDPDGRCPICPWLDAVVDIGFVVYDIGELAYDKATTGSTSATSWGALAADVASIAVPMSVGAGLAVRAGAKAAETTVKVVKAEKIITKADDAKKIITKTEKAVAKEGEGVIYKRVDKTGNTKDYVGQAKSDKRYDARQKEHSRANKDADYSFEKIDNGTPGKDLNMKEQKHLDAAGGPTNKSNPSGGTSNKKNVIKK